MPTFIITIIGSVVAIGLIRYIFFIEYPVFSIKEEIWNIIILVIFPWIPIVLWMRKPFRILSFNNNYRGRFFFQIICWFTMASMLFSFQEYISTSTGKLIEALNVDKIKGDSDSKARYYKINQFVIDTASSGTFVRSHVSGKYRRNLDYEIYYVAPVISSRSSVDKYIPKYWFGLVFEKRISNRIEGSEKEALYQAFYQKTMEEIKRSDFKNFDHFERLPNSKKRDFFLNAIEASTAISNKNYVVFKRMYGSYENRSGKTLAWTFYFFGIGLVLMSLLLIWPKCEGKHIKRKV